MHCPCIEEAGRDCMIRAKRGDLPVDARAAAGDHSLHVSKKEATRNARNPAWNGQRL
jgi:hypothetical protein